MQHHHAGPCTDYRVGFVVLWALYPYRALRISNGFFFWNQSTIIMYKVLCMVPRFGLPPIPIHRCSARLLQQRTIPLHDMIRVHFPHTVVQGGALSGEWRREGGVQDACEGVRRGGARGGGAHPRASSQATREKRVETPTTICTFDMNDE